MIFPLADQLLHRLPDFLPRCGPVDVMHLVQVDMIGLQAPEAGIAGAADVIRRQVFVVGADVHRLVHFCGQYDPVATGLVLRQPLADVFLGDAEALGHVGRLRTTVDVGGIEDVDTSVQSRVHDAETVRFVGQLSEVHAAQRDRADFEARAAKVSVIHRVFSCSPRIRTEAVVDVISIFLCQCGRVLARALRSGFPALPRSSPAVTWQWM